MPRPHHEADAPQRPALYQLGFDALLADAETENGAYRFDRETAHLPDSMEEGIALYRELVERYHAATLAADVETVMQLQRDAHNLALPRMPAMARSSPMRTRREPRARDRRAGGAVPC